MPNYKSVGNVGVRKPPFGNHYDNSWFGKHREWILSLDGENMKRNRISAKSQNVSSQIISCKGHNSNHALQKPDTTLTTFDFDQSYITSKEQMDIVALVMCFSEKDTRDKSYCSLEC